MVQSSIPIEDEIAETLIKEIQQEIDEGVMLSLLVECGWTKVPYYFTNSDHAVDVMMWLDDTPRKNWKRLNGSFVFKNKKDAEWFILRWL
jgi:hypothetical protein